MWYQMTRNDTEHTMIHAGPLLCWRYWSTKIIINTPLEIRDGHSLVRFTHKNDFRPIYAFCVRDHLPSLWESGRTLYECPSVLLVHMCQSGKLHSSFMHQRHVLFTSTYGYDNCLIFLLSVQPYTTNWGALLPSFCCWLSEVAIMFCSVCVQCVCLYITNYRINRSACASVVWVRVCPREWKAWL